MTWRSYLQFKTRQPEFLWRMVIGILVAGVALGYLAEYFCDPKPLATLVEQIELAPETDLPEEWQRADELANNHQWAELWWAIPRAAYRYDDVVGPLCLALVAGVCWFVFLWQCLKTPGPHNVRLWAALAAVALGVLSIWPTIFASYWCEQMWGLEKSSELIPGLRYFILSVGLREELAKLLCVLPLMPLLLRLREELTVLVVSGCVGLGFAIEENVGYFSAWGGIAVLVRYLTANPLHITLTGLAGLMMYRAIRDPKGWGPHALGVFGMLVFAHGLYDAFSALFALVEYGIFSMIIFALVVYQFFHEFRELRTSSGDTISLSATFLLAVSLLTTVTFIYTSATIGTSASFDLLATQVLGQAVMVYLFLREMPESMVTV